MKLVERGGGERGRGRKEGKESDCTARHGGDPSPTKRIGKNLSRRSGYVRSCRKNQRAGDSEQRPEGRHAGRQDPFRSSVHGYYFAPCLLMPSKCLRSVVFVAQLPRRCCMAGANLYRMVTQVSDRASFGCYKGCIKGDLVFHQPQLSLSEPGWRGARSGR